MSQTVGAKLRQLRLRAKWTYRQIATATGISIAHLNDIEHDRRGVSERVSALLGIVHGHQEDYFRSWWLEQKKGPARKPRITDTERERVTTRMNKLRTTGEAL